MESRRYAARHAGGFSSFGASPNRAVHCINFVRIPVQLTVLQRDAGNCAASLLPDSLPAQKESIFMGLDCGTRKYNHTNSTALDFLPVSMI